MDGTGLVGQQWNGSENHISNNLFSWFEFHWTFNLCLSSFQQSTRHDLSHVFETQDLRQYIFSLLSELFRKSHLWSGPYLFYTISRKLACFIWNKISICNIFVTVLTRRWFISYNEIKKFAYLLNCPLVGGKHVILRFPGFHWHVKKQEVSDFIVQHSEIFIFKCISPPKVHRVDKQKGLNIPGPKFSRLFLVSYPIHPENSMKIRP